MKGVCFAWIEQQIVRLARLDQSIDHLDRVLKMHIVVGGRVNEQQPAMQLIRRFRDEHTLTIVLIEHVMRFLVALSDRALIMHHGQKIYEGPASGLARDKTAIEVYLGERMAERLRHEGAATANDG